MVHNSSENLIQSDSSTSTDELNNGSHSRSVEKVSKKRFHKKKAAFVGANSVTSSSVTSSPQQHHPIIVVGTADVHRALASPPKPLPRKQLPIDSSAGTSRKQFARVDDIIEMSVSGDSESSNKIEQGKEIVAKREEIELRDLKSPSGSSGVQSDRADESKMFFARSRKNTIVTNIDEVSTKSSGRSESRSLAESKPLPKPRQHIQPQYEIVHEKSSEKRVETTPEHRTISELSQSNSIDSGSETYTESEGGNDNRGRSAHHGSAEDQIDQETTQKSDVIERLIGIYIHSSSELKFDYNVHKPMVRCSIIDTTSGQLLRIRNNGKSQPLDDKDIIQTVMTKGCRFTSSSIFQCQWEQLLIINESIAQLMHENIIIFFEILDTPSSESHLFFNRVSREKNVWHYVCWGFLRPGDGTKWSNVDRRSCVQLYRYHRRNLLRKCSLNVYDQFRFNRIRYPATITVTVKGIIPSEPQFNFPKEVDNEPSAEFRKIKSETQKITDTENVTITTTNFLRRLPGQICKHPNTVHKTHLQPSSKGCLASKFSPNGQYLAYSFGSDYNIQIATVPDLKVINTLCGHTNFVYDLDWMADKRKNSFPLHLVSASSDRTAVVWTIEKDGISLTILPHPSFLYAAKFLVNLSTDGCCLFAVTGGRDCTIRVWKIGPDHNFDLLQESNDHDNYITSIVCPTKTNGFYSSDWNGFIFEWSYQTISSNFQVTRKFPKLNDGISSLQLHPKNEHRLYAQLKTHQIVCLDATNEIVLNSLGSTDDDRRINNKFTISPCGSTIYTALGDTIFMYNILTGSLHSSMNVPHIKNQRGSYISHLDYHPKLFLLCAALYGSNGGIVLLTHKMEPSSSAGVVEAPVRQDSFDDRWMLLKQNVHPRSSELLGYIIRRIDDILHQPQPNRNETDDLKHETIANKRTEDGARSVVDDVDVGSLTIVSENESDMESGGTFTVRSRSISEVSNRTFTLIKNGDGPNGLARVNDGTYSIKGDTDSDDTTISESM